MVQDLAKKNQVHLPSPFNEKAKMISYLKNNPLLDLLSIEFPIIQGGMVWVSGHKLASACAKAGIIGTLSAGSMNEEVLSYHLQKCFEILSPIERKRIAINIPLLYEKSKRHIEIALEFGIDIFITSAGSPKLFTAELKNKGKKVIHVTSSAELALKCEHAGVDAVIAEGFEAGGHNGREEITTLVLIPQVVDALKIPVIAAGGIYDGRSILAAQALGAHGVQMGSRFLMTQESSAHENVKKLFLTSKSSDTFLRMKKHVPVRLHNNLFSDQIKKLEDQGATTEELKNALGKGRAKLGLLDGDIQNGELEIGQVIGSIHDLPTCSELIKKIIYQYKELLNFSNH